MTKDLTDPANDGQSKVVDTKMHPCLGRNMHVKMIAMTPIAKPVIYDFLDVIQYLKSILQWRQSLDAKFSIATWAEELGVGSRITLRFILRRQRTLSGKTAAALRSSLKLNSQEAHYFETLISYTQAKSTSQREAFGKILIKISKENFQQKEIHALTAAKSIYGPMVLTLMTFGDLRKDTATMADLLGIETAELQSIVSDLEADGTIRRLDDGTYFFGETDFRIPGHLSLKKFHEFWIDQARQALDLPFETRRCRALKFALSEDEFAKVAAQMNEAALTILAQFQSHTALAGRRLYLFEAILFPITKMYPEEINKAPIESRPAIDHV